MIKRIFSTVIAVSIVGIIIIISSSSQVSAVSITPPVPVPTVDYVLPYPGLLPTHPLYPLKLWRDKIVIWITRNPVKRSEIHLLLSDKQIGMGKVLWETQQYDASIGVFHEAEMHLLEGVMALAEYKKTDTIPPGVVDKFELANKKHEEVLMSLINSGISNTLEDKLSSILTETHQAKQQIATLK